MLKYFYQDFDRTDRKEEDGESGRTGFEAWIERANDL